MGRGSLRAPGSPLAWLLLLLLLLRRPWSVWGAEAFRGEWERPEGRLGHCQGLEGLNRPPPPSCSSLPGMRRRQDRELERVGKVSLGSAQGFSPELGLRAQTCTLCPTATVLQTRQSGWNPYRLSSSAPPTLLPGFPDTILQWKHSCTSIP